MSIGEQIRNALQQDTGYRLRVAMGLVPGVSTVHLYGRSPGVDTTERVLWAPGAAAYGGWLSAAAPVRVKAGGNAADAAAGNGARKVLVTGLDADFAEASEEITTNGASASSPTATSFIRVLEAHVTDCGSYATPYNTGDVSIETTGGVEVIRMLAGRAQSQVGVYTVPAGKVFYLAHVGVSVEGSKAATLRLWMRANAGDVVAPYTAQRLVNEWPVFQGALERRHETWEAYAAKTDLWVSGFAALVSTACSAEIEGYLVDA